jgi:hypothetical protein
MESCAFLTIKELLEKHKNVMETLKCNKTITLQLKELLNIIELFVLYRSEEKDFKQRYEKLDEILKTEYDLIFKKLFKKYKL